MLARTVAFLCFLVAVAADLQVWSNNVCGDGEENKIKPADKVFVDNNVSNANCFTIPSPYFSYQVTSDTETWAGFLDDHCQQPDSTDRFDSDCHTRQSIRSLRRIS
ncbi:hypothetical protein BC940DRAFT_313731 [Gongronella butleri]|nr:hypothetical protein BC940DRAFT_313731 [Gongronella butleri]